MVYATLTLKESPICYNSPPVGPIAITTVLALILLIATIVPYANSFDSDETPGYSASHPDPSCLQF